MTSVNKLRRSQKGISLVELVVASAVSIIAIGAVGQVYISGQKNISDRTRLLMLRQDVNDAMRMISDDVLRAGFSSRGGTIKLSGATGTVEVDPISGEWLSFVTEKNSSKWDVRQYKLLETASRPFPWIKYCHRTSGAIPTDPTSLVSEITADVCESGSDSATVLDPKRISVDTFTITQQAVSSSAATSQKLTITLGASLPATGESYQKQKTVLLRNWQ